MSFDVTLFWIVLFLLFAIGLPTIRRTVSLPAELEMVEVPRSKLTPPLAAHFRTVDANLSDLRFSPLMAFRVTNLSSDNTIRLYLHASGTSFCLATCLGQDTPEGRVGQNYLEIIDEFTDGTSLTTRSCTIASVFAENPRKLVQDVPDAEPSALWACHQQSLATIRRESRIWKDAAAILQRGREGHREMCQFQCTQGRLEFDAKAGVYRATYRMGLAGIANFLNPLADQFTFGRFLPVLLVAVLLPLIGMPWLETAAPGWFPQSPGNALAAELAGKALLVTLAGIVVGRNFSGKTFLWSFLATYLPQAFTGQRGDAWLLWCLWAGWVADFVSRRQLAVQDLHQPTGKEEPPPAS